jgi:hypothetical protein
MARAHTPALRSVLYLLVLMPLWSSYVVRVYAWKLILAREGVLNWVVGQLGLQWLLDGVLSLPVIGGPSLSLSFIGTFLVFVYIWLPYMVLPIAAALERIPRSLLEASSDLGGRPGHTFRQVVVPLVLPGVVAGSIFTFSLTLGDYIIPGVDPAGDGGEHPAGGRLHGGADGDHGPLPHAGAQARRLRGAVSARPFRIPRTRPLRFAVAGRDAASARGGGARGPGRGERASW